MRAGKSLSVSSADIRRLKAVVQDRNAPQKHVWRAEIVLLTADGVGTNEIMRRTAKSKTCVWRWQERFLEDGFDGLLRDKTRPSRIKPLRAEATERVVALTLGDPPGETTHWTGALMAKAAGLSVSSVQRIWRAHGLQPHRMRQFKLSNDPRFVDKLRDVVGLYVDPPAHAIVLSVDEKSQIQALDRTQPGLPLKKGRAGTMTHDYERHGTTTLFAAMNVLDGTVIGRNMQRIAIRSSFASSMSSRSRFPLERRFTPSSTITPPISIPMFADGSNAIPDGRSISPRHRPLGSTPSRASSQPSQSEGSSAASFAPSPTCKPRSTASSKSTISYRRPSPGPPIQTKSSPQSGAGTKC
jgi:transposase